MSSPILHLMRMSWPADWAAIYGREAPLLLELGFGGGDNLITLARSNSAANVLGVEISLPSLKRGAKKIATAGLNNARVLQGDSFAALWLLFHPQSISGVTINFPDPWPKSGHQRRRIINQRFLDLLATRMEPDAPLDIATDHEEYAAVIEYCLEQATGFDSRTSQPYLLDVPNRRRTKYEQIALSEGRTPRYFLWRRNNFDVPEEFPILEEADVPHMVLISSFDLDQIGNRFEPFHVQEEEIHIKFLNMYRSFADDLLLAEVFVSEEPYPQRVALSLRTRKTGDLVLSVHELGFPRPTRGVHLAIGLLASWLKEQDPGLTIINSTLSPQTDKS